MADDARYTLSTINMLDQSELWVTAHDDTGEEIDLTITGLSLQALAAWIDKTPESRRLFDVARSTVET